MTAYVRTGRLLAKRRRVLAAAEARLRGALKRSELQTGTDLDDEHQSRLVAADEADQAWRAATADEIIAAYTAQAPVTPGHIPAAFGRASSRW